MIQPSPMTYHGVKFFIAYPLQVPNFRISDNVDLSPEYRKDINAWCFDFFGGKTIEIVEDDVYIKAPEGIVLNEKTYKKFENQIAHDVDIRTTKQVFYK